MITSPGSSGDDFVGGPGEGHEDPPGSRGEDVDPAPGTDASDDTDPAGMRRLRAEEVGEGLGGDRLDPLGDVDGRRDHDHHEISVSDHRRMRSARGPRR